MDERRTSCPQQPDNTAIADLLSRIADLLETQDDGFYRARAYRNASTKRVSNSARL